MPDIAESLKPPFLLDYQTAWVRDRSPVKVWLAPRRSGVSTAVAVEVAQVASDPSGGPVVVVASSVDAADELAASVASFGGGFVHAPRKHSVLVQRLRWPVLITCAYAWEEEIDWFVRNRLIRDDVPCLLVFDSVTDAESATTRNLQRIAHTALESLHVTTDDIGRRLRFAFTVGVDGDQEPVVEEVRLFLPTPATVVVTTVLDVSGSLERLRAAQEPRTEEVNVGGLVRARARLRDLLGFAEGEGPRPLSGLLRLVEERVQSDAKDVSALRSGMATVARALRLRDGASPADLVDAVTRQSVVSMLHEPTSSPLESERGYEFVQRDIDPTPKVESVVCGDVQGRPVEFVELVDQARAAGITTDDRERAESMLTDPGRERYEQMVERGARPGLGKPTAAEDAEYQRRARVFVDHVERMGERGLLGPKPTELERPVALEGEGWVFVRSTADVPEEWVGRDVEWHWVGAKPHGQGPGEDGLVRELRLDPESTEWVRGKHDFRTYFAAPGLWMRPTKGPMVG